MEEAPPPRPSSVVHAPKRSQSSRGTRASRRDSARNSPYPSRAPTPAPEAPPADPPYSDSHVQGIAVMLDTLPPQFALTFLPGIEEIENFSSGEMVIIPLLCSIVAALSARPTPSVSPPNLAPLEASIASLSARLPPPVAPASSFASVAARPPLQPSSSSTPPEAQHPPQGRKGKKILKKSTSPSSPVQVAKASAASPPPKPPSALPSAERRFFASRLDPISHPSALHIIRSFPNIAANALHEANCPFPLLFTTMCNRKGAVTLLANSPFTPAFSYSPYFDLLSARLNQAFPIGDNPFLPFRLAPSETQMVIHSIPTDILPPLKEDLQQVMATTLLNSCEVTVLNSC